MNIDPTWVRNGFVPNFFEHKGKQRYGEGDLCVEYEKESDRFWGLLYIPAAIISVFGFGCGPIMLVLTICDGKWHELWMPLLGICMLIIGVALFKFVNKKPNSGEGRGHEYFASLSRLFTEFEIEPSVETGDMSLEEFRANIESALRAKGELKDQQAGFQAVATKTKFKSMHAAALEWTLCHESHTKYFPTKK